MSHPSADRRRRRAPQRAIDLVLYCLARVALQLFAALPLGMALRLGRGLGSFTYHVVRLRREVVLWNLRHVFGASKTEAELRGIAKAAYREFAMTLVEVARSVVADPKHFELHTEVESLERLLALQADGTPLIVCAPHHGNFDLLGIAVGARGLRVHAIMKPFKSPRFNRLIVGVRERFGLKMLMRGPDSFQELFELLFDGHTVALLPDQRPRKYGVDVEFLGKPASTFKGPAVLHLVTEAVLVVAVDERLAPDPRKHRARVTFLPPYEPTGDRDADIQAVTQQISDAMGEVILQHPEQYFWFHRRWKERPGRKTRMADSSGCGR